MNNDSRDLCTRVAVELTSRSRISRSVSLLEIPRPFLWHVLACVRVDRRHEILDRRVCVCVYATR